MDAEVAEDAFVFVLFDDDTLASSVLFEDVHRADLDEFLRQLRVGSRFGVDLKMDEHWHHGDS